MTGRLRRVTRAPFASQHRLARATPGTGARAWRRRGNVLLSLAGPAVAIAVLSGSAALAYWLTTDSSNPAAAQAATLSAPTSGMQTGQTPGSVSISWTAPTGYTPTSYTVSRCLGSSCTPATAITSGGCSGQIIATSCTDTDGELAPGKTYSYAVTAVLDNWVSSPGAAFQGSTTPASQLGFTVQPGHNANIQATGSGTFTVSVAIEDSSGNTVTSDNSDDVTLAVGDNPGGGVLSCTNDGELTVQVVAGVANFTGCSITTAGTGYTLTASSNATPLLTAPTNANSFNIVAGAPSKLAFTTAAIVGPPSASAELGPLTVQLEDQNGNVATAGAGGVSLGLSASPSAGAVFATSSGGSPVTSVTIGSGSSSASFYLGDSNSENPVTVTASAAGLTSATQNETIGADKLAFTTSALSDTASDSAVDGPLALQLENASGAAVDAGAGGLTVDLTSTSTGTYRFASSSGGGSVTSVTIPSGSSSVSFYYGDELAGTPTITASATGVTASAQTETITAGPAAGLSFSGVSTNSGSAAVSCTGTVGSSSFACTISPQSASATVRDMTGEVTLIDQFQNPTMESSNVFVTFAQSGGVEVLPLAPTALEIPAGSSSTSPDTFDETLVPLTTDQATVTATATVNSGSVQAKITS